MFESPYHRIVREARELVNELDAYQREGIGIPHSHAHNAFMLLRKIVREDDELPARIEQFKREHGMTEGENP